MPQGLCGKSECGDFDNKRAVTDRRREKTGGQPAQRACPRVFSKTQAKALVSFERFCAKKILLEKVKIALLTFSRYAAEAAQGKEVNAKILIIREPLNIFAEGKNAASRRRTAVVP